MVKLTNNEKLFLFSGTIVLYDIIHCLYFIYFIVFSYTSILYLLYIVYEINIL